MLEMIIPAIKQDIWDEKKEMFISCTIQKDLKLRFEHSLKSIADWESKWEKPFFSSDLSDEEFFDYVKQMTITPNVDPKVYDMFTQEQFNTIAEYLKAPMTATKFSNKEKKGGVKKIITSELIYCWMTELNIPFECEKWNIKRLLALIQICEDRQTPPKKMSQKELMRRNDALNNARRKKLHSKG